MVDPRRLTGKDLDARKQRRGRTDAGGSQRATDAERAKRSTQPAVRRKRRRTLKAEKVGVYEVDEGRAIGEAPRGDGAVESGRDILDDHRIGIAARRIALVDQEAVFGNLGVEIAGAEIEHPVLVGPPHGFKLETPDIGVDIVVDRGPRNDPAELEIVVHIIKGCRVQRQRAVHQHVTRTEFEGVDRLRPEGLGDREDRLDGRIDAARFIAARIGEVERIVRRILPIEHGAAGQLGEVHAARLEGLNARRAGIAVKARRGGRVERVARRPMGDEEIGQRRSRGEVLLIDIVAQTAGELQVVGDVPINLAERAIGFEPEVLRIVAKEWRGEIGRRKTVCEAGKRAQHTGDIVDRKGVDIIVDITRIDIGVDCAEQEVDRPVEIGVDDRFERPGLRVPTGTVEGVRNLAAKAVAAERAKAGRIGVRGTERTVRAVRDQCIGDRRKKGRRAGHEGGEGRRKAGRDAVRAEKGQRVERRRKE